MASVSVSISVTTKGAEPLREVLRRNGFDVESRQAIEKPWVGEQFTLRLRAWGGGGGGGGTAPSP